MSDEIGRLRIAKNAGDRRIRNLLEDLEAQRQTIREQEAEIRALRAALVKAEAQSNSFEDRWRAVGDDYAKERARRQAVTAWWRVAKRTLARRHPVEPRLETLAS